ncbi:MAG: hypothetical protein IKZ91_00810 [Bacteroidales bacterium]|nr:hypothetical protein [Bacteroidales bacterium]
MMKKILASVFLSLAVLTAGAQVYVATDKSCYLAGERIWCSVFCAEGPAVAYLELVSTDGPAARTRIDVRGGRGGGYLQVPLSAPTGNYMLCAYSGPADAGFGGPVLSVFNTYSNERVQDGVEIVAPEEFETAPQVPSGYGFSVDTSGGVVIENVSGKSVSCSISLTRSDSMAGPENRSIASFTPGVPRPEPYGEVIKAVLAGPDASKVVPGNLIATVAVPGAKTDCYTACPDADGTVSFEVENIFGSGDIVYMLEGLDPGMNCHLEPVSPFLSPKVTGLPKLKLSRSMEADLLRRAAALREEKAADTLAVTLPVRRPHFMLTHESVTYILDDYTRFPTMEEVFVEITQYARLRHPGGKTKIYSLMYTSVNDLTPRWGDAVAMVDGVPVADQKLIETYDPAIVKAVEVYPYRYNMGFKVFDGVVNLVTFQGNMPGVLFDDNVRIYDFQGCAWPMCHSGSETPYWHPLVTLEPGERIELPCEALQTGVEYTVSVEGLASGGVPVHLRKTFVR